MPKSQLVDLFDVFAVDRVNLHEKYGYPNDEAVTFMLALATGELGEAEAADWLRARLG